MRSRYLERGSHVVIAIVIVLSVAVVVLLGLVFWQNFINKPATEDQSSTVGDTSQEVDDNALTQSAVLEVRGVKTTLNYPSNWQYEAGELEDIYEDGTAQHWKSTLTSPDGSVTITYSLSDLAGVGGTCYDSSYETTPPQPSLVSLQWNAIDGASDAIFVSQINKRFLDGELTGYAYWFGAYENSDDVKNLEAGADALEVCGTFAYAHFVEVARPTENALVVQAYATFNDQGEYFTGNSVEEIEASFNSETGKTAKSIIESLKV